MINIIKKNPLISIMRNIPLEHTLDYAQAVYNGGIKAFEVAFNSEHAAKQIAMLRNHFGDSAIIGAGTTITLERVQLALDAGAQFLLTPSTNIKVLEYAQKNNIPLLPGVMTPTDVDICCSYGFKTLKLFPASSQPSSYIASLKGPFDDTEYVAVGGVSADNLNTFYENGFIGAGIGSNLIPQKLLASHDWEGATQHIQHIVKNSKW
ncbi:MAG: bifunctional 4-hydroxy-2-oxoglutarate aldolase/2-dehydro-3-deoxy-phosphogluconate aldolase [Anaerolineaceae bacterium]|nr:MAG: bifunctional 4-hydroxy-2-oxoglutarate aldolase/2-dehydro-3-deoxy-phosphogluconate aldolase [Anaerolineaceae bacterium]